MLPEGVGVVGGEDGLVGVPVASGVSVGVLVVIVVPVVMEVLVVSGGPDGPTKGTSSVLCHYIYLQFQQSDTHSPGGHSVTHLLFILSSDVPYGHWHSGTH